MTSALLPNNLLFRAFAQGGASPAPLALGWLYFYQAGTSTPQAAYSDATGTMPLVNPLQLDANGQASFWLKSGLAYKINLKDSAFNQQLFWPIDGIVADPSQAALTAALAALTAFEVQLADTVTPGNGDTLVGTKRSNTGAVGATLGDWIEGQDISINEFLTTAQIADTMSGTPTLDLSSQIQGALTNCTGRRLIFPGVKYKINTGLSQPATTCVDLGKAIFDCSGITGTGYAWTIAAAGDIAMMREIMHGGTFLGVATPGNGVYSATLNGLSFQTSQIRVSNIDFRGFQHGYDFGSGAYVVTMDHCAGWYNKIAVFSDQTLHTTMGAALFANNCVFPHNDWCLYNRLCEWTFRNCSFDQMQQGVVQANCNSAGGAFNSQVVFDTCRFEAGGVAAQSWFTNDISGNQGVMVFRDCIWFEPFNFVPGSGGYLFNNNGIINIQGGMSRDGTLLYNSQNTGTFTAKGIKQSAFYTGCVRFVASTSGIYNSDFELGTTANWSAVVGSLANMTIVSATPHQGTKNANFLSAGAAAEYAVPIQLQQGSSYLVVDFYYKNANASNGAYVKFYDQLGAVIGTQLSITMTTQASWTIAVMKGTIPAGAAYAKFGFTMANTDAGAVQLDDLYTNQW